MAEELPSNRSADEVLDSVRTRGRKLAARRRASAGFAAVLGTAMILPAGVLAIGGEGPTTLAGAASTPTTVATSVAPAVLPGVDTTISIEPSPITPVVGDGDTRPASPRPAAPTPPTTSRRARPTVTTPQVTVGRLPAGPSLPVCGPSQLEASARSLKPSYVVGEQVALSAFILNSSARDCTYRRFEYRFTITRDGFPISTVTTSGGGDEESVFVSGQAFAAEPTWNRDQCPEGPCEAGYSYSAIFSWTFDGGPTIEKSAPFRLEAPPTTTTTPSDPFVPEP